MICPKCKSTQHKVNDSRPSRQLCTEDNFIYRRRECLNCEHRWTTREVLILDVGSLKESLVTELAKHIDKCLESF